MPQAVRQTKRSNIWISYLSLFFLGFVDNLRGPLLPKMMQDYGLTSSQGGFLFATASLCAFFSAALVPGISKKWGHRSSLIFALFLMTSSQLVAFFTRGFWGLFLSALFLGVSIGVLGVLQNVLVLFASERHNRAKMTGGLHANYAGASLLAPLLVGLILSREIPFQFCFLVSAGVGVLLLLSLIQHPRFYVPNLAGEPEIVVGHPTEPCLATSPRPQSFGLILLFACVLSSYVLAEIVISSRLSQYTFDVLKWPIEESGRPVLWFFAGLFLGRLLLTCVKVKTSPHRLLLFCLAGSFFCSILGLYVSPFFFGLLGLIVGPCYPLAISCLSEFFPAQIEPATTAAVVGSGLFVVVMHVVVGWISDFYGVGPALLVGPLFFLISGTLLLLFLSRTIRQEGVLS